MEVQGKIKVLENTVEVGAKAFKKRLLVLTTDDQYPQHIAIEFIQDKTDLINQYKVGQDVKVSINLGGREWINPEGVAKYFNSVQGWRIEKLETAATENLPPVEQFAPVDAGATEPDDLPF
jgi:hypothetical protein